MGADYTDAGGEKPCSRSANSDRQFKPRVMPLHSTYYLAPGRPPDAPAVQAANNLHGTIYHTGYDHVKTFEPRSTAANSCGRGDLSCIA